MVVVNDVVGVVDGGCAGVVSDDVADSGGDEGLVAGWGTVSVDVPTSLSGRGGSSQVAAWVTASAVEVDVVWELESAVSCVV